MRGATYLGAAAKYPVKEEADKLRSLGTADLEKIIGANEGKTAEISAGIRTKSIYLLAKHYEVSGNKERAETYRKMLTAK